MQNIAWLLLFSDWYDSSDGSDWSDQSDFPVSDSLF